MLWKQAWRFIRFDRIKSIGVVMGIVISIFLIGQQMGIFTFLTGLMTTLIRNSEADIWVIDTKSTNANALSTIDIRKLREVMSIDGVANAYALVIANASAQFSNGSSGGLLLVGSDPPYFKALSPSITIKQGSIQDLEKEDAVSLDYFDSKLFGGNTAVGTAFEINGKKTFVAMQTAYARTFGGSLSYTTADRARYYAQIPSNKINAILITLKKGYIKQKVIDDINHSIYGVHAWDKNKLSQETAITVLASTGIGVSTGTLIIFAIISGFFIIGLTMYSGVLDRIKDYGTLKAIGATNGYIRKLILAQSLIFACIGFVLAYSLLMGFRIGISKSGVQFSYTWYMVIALFLTTMAIAILGAIFAIRRVNLIEPASVFR